ncbi:4-hydroxy-tetrahydrodipicolinate synthase [Paenibacillus taihuensis]|uniref:4-hydroxy-tetrahydrodipicolinate synthase n=1 Tax=Paenibacillus taihuensis TaxID=1156355 RepID=A0A3D9RVV0_9BACL|nr:4-hydroxy-tetrahydrodipicolinate synthase [Paenibacillus taihuensis]REE81206.1 4-hydroxy-tetrahydrodipicolinate synthase [Paenibacillus taihuensis]
MLTESQLQGIYVPVVTPFLANEEIDFAAYERYLMNLLSHDIDGLVINGTTAEAPTVTWDEVAEIVRLTSKLLRDTGKQLPLVIGTGTNDTRSTIMRTEQAAQLGADAVLVVTPYYSRPSQAGILQHFERAASVGIPVIAYEVPARTGIRVEADTMRKILEIDGVIGLKDSSGDLRLIRQLMESGCSKPILCGEDAGFYEMLGSGAKGGILASANLRTSDFMDVYRAYQAGDTARAEATFQSLSPLIGLLFKESNPTPLKWMLARQGLINSDAVRLPMTGISEGLRARLCGFHE